MSRVEHLAEGVTLYLGDSLEIAPTLRGIDCVVTSPPYGQQRDYGKKIDNWRNLVSGVLTNLSDKGDTQILVNLGLIHRDGEVIPYWQDLIEDMYAAKWRHFGWYVWDKGFGLPGNWNGRLAPAHEFIFHFNRAAREANKWARTRDRSVSGSGLRNVDGSMSGISSPDKCGQSHKVPDSVLRFPPHQLRGGIENEHPALFPIALPNHLIQTFTSGTDIVCDPFMGSGTTGVACVKLGRKFIGIELEPKYFDIACRRISDALSRPDMFIERPAKIKQETLQL